MKNFMPAIRSAIPELISIVRRGFTSIINLFCDIYILALLKTIIKRELKKYYWNEFLRRNCPVNSGSVIHACTKKITHVMLVRILSLKID